MFVKPESIQDSTENEQGESILTDYNTYIMSDSERILSILLAMAVIYVIGFIFYRSFVIPAMLCPIALFYPGIRIKEIINKRKNDLNLQFKDMLYALSSSISAGKAVESALKDVLKDLAIQYPDPETSILKEVEYILRRIEMNITIEAALEDFSKRSHLEDVKNFSDVFNTCRKSGGNVVEIIKNTSNIISDKIEIKQEIDTLLAQKKFEQKVLNIMPIVMILILSVSAGDYMEPVFTTVQGKAIMTVSMLLLVFSYFITSKIMDINI